MEKKDKPRRRREIFYDPLGEQTTDQWGHRKQEFLEGQICYREGGANYFSGGTERRGYEIMVSVVYEEESDRDDGSVSKMKGFMLAGPGLRKLVQEAKRFDSKTFEALAVPPEEIQTLKKDVISQWEERKARDGR